MTLIGQLKLLLLPTLRFMLFLLAVVSNDLHLMAVNSLVTIKGSTAAYLKVYVVLVSCATHCVLLQ